MISRISILFLLGLALPAWAQHAAPPATDPNAAFQPLTERTDVLSWKTLAQVELVKQKDRYVPQFSASVAALDKKDVKLQGFMMPLEMGDKQSHFVLAAMPTTCAFCMPGGPDSLIEVLCKTPIAFNMEPITISGKLAVLKDDPTGLWYRVTEATLVSEGKM